MILVLLSLLLVVVLLLPVLLSLLLLLLLVVVVVVGAPAADAAVGPAPGARGRDFFKSSTNPYMQGDFPGSSHVSLSPKGLSEKGDPIRGRECAPPPHGRGCAGGAAGAEHDARRAEGP